MMNLIYIKEPIDIECILKKFKDTLKSLKRGDNFIGAMAIKFADNADFIAMYDKTKCIGFVAFYKNDDVNFISYISMIAVDKSYQGIGIGKKLINEAEEKAKCCGMKYVRLEVDSDNINAQKFYNKCGYTILLKKTNSMIMQKIL